MKVKYTIESGIAPFNVILSGSSGSYNNTHNSIGDFYFLNVINGIYNLKVIDSLSCIVMNTNLNIDNSLFIINANTYGTNIDTQNDYSGNTVFVKENNYTIDSLPLVADAAIMSYDINYSLNTSVDNGNTSLVSIIIYKNGIQINNDNVINSNSNNLFTISIVNTDIIRVKLYANTTKIGGTGTAIGTINISLSNFKINGNLYSSVDLSGASKSLILNS